MPKRVYGDLDLYGRLLREARPYWPHIAVMFGLSLLSTPIALLTPLPLKIVVDSVVGAHPLPEFLAWSDGAIGSVLLLAVALVVVIALLEHLRHLSSSVLAAYTGEKLLLGFRAQLFRHVQRLSLSYHDSKGTADSVFRIQYDAGAIQWIAVHGVTPFIGAGLTLAGMVYVTARIDWQLALVALGVSPVILVVTLTARRHLRSGWDRTKTLESSALSVVQEVLTSLRVVKAFGQEDREQERFVSRSGESMRMRIRLAVVEGFFGLLFGLTIAAGTALVLFIGARHVQAGLLTLGDLVLVLAYLAQLYLPIQVMSGTIRSLQASLAGAARAFALLDEVADVVEKVDARPLARAAGAVAFRDVSFAYEGREPILRAVSFEIGPGVRLGIVGATGAGKTTIVSLLTRFYDPAAGRILLDGVDLRDYRLADLRRQFSIVLQEPVLFSTSVAENIAYARPEASEHEVIEAAKAANAHDFIMGLPEGYETLVGERGMRLSGGERQRIALARAFLKDAPVLILDEPTSSVDTKTEAAIMDAMERLMRGRTTIMIAHRLATLAHCDARLEIDDGRLSGVDVPDATRLVLREPALFSGTVAENIGNGKPGMRFSKIIEAAQLADAHRSILFLPDGYDTQVGENGETLSEAARQRIALARAVLCDPKILVLDSGAGPETWERLVQEAVGRLTRVNDTTFVIAHPLSGIRDTDRLVVTEDGRVLETGSYQDVIARKGAFRHLVNAERGMLSVVALGDRR